ncbi:hypothetical protein DPMN_099198 [Dreissena polymorpha]|uniref:Uncharacterized protein n=1 Tax=Dreissena polymorpha TaxID=45954 RepID=A0A9D4R672_DREPO|nr:hypothetical protein DPMN_099198 [Dreissena polymorpha]
MLPKSLKWNISEQDVKELDLNKKFAEQEEVNTRIADYVFKNETERSRISYESYCVVLGEALLPSSSSPWQLRQRALYAE